MNTGNRRSAHHGGRYREIVGKPDEFDDERLFPERRRRHIHDARLLISERLFRNGHRGSRQRHHRRVGVFPAEGSAPNRRRSEATAGYSPFRDRSAQRHRLLVKPEKRPRATSTEQTRTRPCAFIAPLPPSRLDHRGFEKKFDLRIDTSEFIGRPLFQRGVEFGIEAKKESFFSAHEYSVPVLITGWASPSATSATRRLFTIVAFRSSSNSTKFFPSM